MKQVNYLNPKWRNTALLFLKVLIEAILNRGCEEIKNNDLKFLNAKFNYSATL
ncbi:hypothetical protein TUM19329_10060 [Legionella antarctica]|uniref:Uncharacterized protein n=1 Tax=Legionella antarctica TaxID=2708020 RepID=A0A6F8T1V8_9GAMM|nr:hypothetical protein TUM19329_10060 [Legionella antarctica]